MPAGFSLSDPDHLPASEIDSLYRHWQHRQLKKLPPFVVLNASPLHGSSVKKSDKGKGKKKIEYMDVSTNDEQQEEEQDGSDRDEEANGFPLAAKIGPPIGKAKKTVVHVDSGVPGPSSLALKKPVRRERRNGKVADEMATEAKDLQRVDSDIAGPSSSAPGKPIPKEKRKKDSDERAFEAPNTRSSSKRKWGNGEDENFQKKCFQPDNGRRPGRKSDDQALKVNNFIILL